MGFGILFLGYLIGMNFIVKPGIFFFVSSIVMLYALTMLLKINNGFRRAFSVCLPMTLASLVALALEILEMFGKELGIWLIWFNTVQPIFTAVFTWFLLEGIMEIAKETDVQMIFQRAYVQRFFCPIYYVFYIILNFSYSNTFESVGFARFIVIMYLIALVSGIIYMAFNARCIFNCYMWICMPEDLDMEKKDKGGKK